MLIKHEFNNLFNCLHGISIPEYLIYFIMRDTDAIKDENSSSFVY